MNRRNLLQGLAATQILGLAGLPGQSTAATATLASQELREHISLISGAGGNVVVFRGESALTLLDSGAQTHVEELLALLDGSFGSVPVKMLINTHWHEDHTGGNEAVHARGAQILAHENTRLWLGADFDVEWRQWSHKPRPPQAMPDTTFYTSGTLDVDGEVLEYHHFPQAHTDGDLCLYFPASNVMVAGGLFSNYRYPIADIATGGWIGGLISANEAMLELVNDSTLIVPDRGPALRKIDLQAQHDMLADLYEQMKVLAREGQNGHDMLRKKLTASYDAAWGDPREFVLETYRGMWAHTYDMGGFI